MMSCPSNGVKPIALLSVSNKTGLIDIARGLHQAGLRLIGSGGTAKAVRDAGLPISDVSEITGAPEMLGGRVKTLHPVVHGGILSRQTPNDLADLAAQSIHPISVVVCNLYPFSECISKTPPPTVEEAVEEVDIGGVTLLRAAAKNHERVTILCDPNDYSAFLQQCQPDGINGVKESFRKSLAVKAFSMTATYDATISSYFRIKYNSADSIATAPLEIKNELRQQAQQLTLRYGANPHQAPAQAYVTTGKLPFHISTKYTSSSIFKHVSPAGVAVGTSEPLTDVEIQVFGVDGIPDLSPLAKAYARARGADRMSSFGDFLALSHTCDVSTAKIISREVSDGVVAPGYEPEALEILRKKKGGKYCVLQMDPSFQPDLIERRQVQGITLEQRRNDVKITRELFKDIVTEAKEIPESAITDLIVATLSLKYTQSNSVAYAFRGGIIGLGAGQQSRIHCTRLAGNKADLWWLRHHPKVLDMKFKKSTKRADKANAIDLYLTDAVFEDQDDEEISIERKEWENNSKKFRRAAKSGVKYIAAPGGSVMDSAVFTAADQAKMVYCKTGLRLFHH
ncbi:hypothetical protein H4Q26_013727 [Puccinia striiformis f. sp. tritici PST-130]|nr:hypothetical protein H4Q26_013727 [Puccinia striiformis f. sp. tritici PST-130]